MQPTPSDCMPTTHAPHPPPHPHPPPPPSYGVLPYLLSKLAAELPVGALFPALFACLVYPATGLNPTPRRFASFLGLLTLEAMSAQVGRQAPTQRCHGPEPGGRGQECPFLRPCPGSAGGSGLRLRLHAC